MNMLKAFLYRDFKTELRGAETLLGVAVFGVTVVLLFAFILPPQSRAGAAAGVFWIAALFATQLSLMRGVERERAGGRLEAILSTSVDPAMYLVARSISTFIFLVASGALLLFATAIFFNIGFASAASALPALLLGLGGIALSGNMVACVAAASRSREIVMPLLFLTLFLPLLLAATATTAAAFDGRVDLLGVAVLFGFDILLGGVSILLIPWVFEE